MSAPQDQRDGAAPRAHAVIAGLGAAVAGGLVVFAAATMVSTGGAGTLVSPGQTTLCSAPSVVILPGSAVSGAPPGLSAPSPSPDPSTAADSPSDASAAGGSDGMDLCEEPGTTPAATPSIP